jgi:hypothetical protein
MAGRMYNPKEEAVSRLGLILQGMKFGQNPKLKVKKWSPYSCLVALAWAHRCRRHPERKHIKVKLLLCPLLS